MNKCAKSSLVGNQGTDVFPAGREPVGGPGGGEGAFAPWLGLGDLIAFSLEGAAEERGSAGPLSTDQRTNGPTSRHWQGGGDSGSSLTDGRRDPLPGDAAGDFGSGASALGAFLLLLLYFRARDRHNRPLWPSVPCGSPCDWLNKRLCLVTRPRNSRALPGKLRSERVG